MDEKEMREIMESININEEINKLDELTKEEPAFKIEDFITVTISNDKLEAYIHTIPYKDKLNLTKQDLMDFLKNNNVVYGIHENVVEEIVENPDYRVTSIIASGRKHIDGEDGSLEFHFNKEPTKKPVLLEDGSVDFRNLNIIQNVEKDQLLVSRVLPTEGLDGMLVTGEIDPAKKGKEFLLPKGKRVRVSEDGLELLADRDGNVELIDGKVSVSNVMTIYGDVDSSTGNLSYNGDIFIQGNVLTGFSVVALGSINVDGFVEAATLKADGDIILKNGVQGSGRGKLMAGGNISAKFIEMTEVYAKGTITTNAIMNSTVESESDIIISGRRGFIIGGLTKALNKIQAVGLGNMSEIATTLEVGFTEESLKKMVSLEQEIKNLSNELDDLEKNMNSFKININQIDLMREKIEKTAKYTSYIKELKRLKDLKQKEQTPRIDIERIINVGTVLFIKSDIYVVKNTMKSTSFRYGSENRIVTISYNKD